VELVLLLVVLNVFLNHEVTSGWLFPKDLHENNERHSSFEARNVGRRFVAQRSDLLFRRGLKIDDQSLSASVPSFTPHC
jgi:hypothetical protein